MGSQRYRVRLECDPTVTMRFTLLSIAQKAHFGGDQTALRQFILYSSKPWVSGLHFFVIVAIDITSFSNNNDP